MALKVGELYAMMTLDNKSFLKGLSASQREMYSTAKNLGNLGKMQFDAGASLTKGLTLPVVGLGIAAGKTAIDFESAFAGVEKTVDGTAEQMAVLRQGIRDMAMEIPTSAEGLAGIAEAAGQLGIELGEDGKTLLGFTRVMADLAETTNLGADGAAQLAKFANIVGMKQTEFDKLGSAIVDLGNNFATTEADIVAMSMRLASAGKQVGMTESDILGFATALSSVGVEAEAGGSAFSKVFSSMQLAVETGSKKLKDFASVAGMSASDFSKAFKEDATSAIIAFVKGLNEGNESATKLLDDMGIKEVRMTDALKRAAGAGDLLTRAVETSNKAWEENVALTNEAEKRYGTMASRLPVLQNQAKDVGISLGEEFVMPALEQGVDVLSNWTKALSKATPAQKNAAKSAALFAAAVGPGLQVLGKGNQVIGNATKAFLQLKGAAAEAGGGITGLVQAGGALIGPAGWIALAGVGIWGLGKGLEWLAENAVTASNEARRAFERVDPQVMERWGDAFESAKQTKATIKVSTTVKSTESLESLVGDFYQPIIDKLASGKTVSSEDAAKVNTAIGEFISSLIASIDADTKAKLEGLKLDLTSGLIDDTDYTAKVKEIVKQAEDAKTKLGELQTKSQTTVGGMVGDSSKTVEDATAELTTLKTEIGSTVDYINGIGDQVKITSLFDEITSKLTDGKKDTKGQKDALIQSVKDEFSGLKQEVETAVNNEIGNLDINSADYDAKVAAIAEKGKTMTDELNALEAAATAFIANQSGKATGAVKAHLGELAEIERRALEVTAQINAAKAADAEQQSAGTSLVKGGGTSDTRTITTALETAKQEYDAAVAAAQAQRDARIKELQEIYAASGKNAEDLEANKAGEVEADAYLAQQMAAIQDAYRRELAQLLEGATEGLDDELSTKISEALGNVDMAEAIQGLMDKIATGEVQQSDISDKVAEAMGLTPEALYQKIQEHFLSLATGFSDTLNDELATVRGDFMQAAAAAMKDLDLGEAGAMIDKAVETGMLDGLDDLNFEDFITKLRALIGDLGQTGEPIKMPVPIAWAPEIAPPAEGEQDLGAQARAQVEDQLSGEIEPVPASVGVEVSPDITAATGEKDLPTAAHDVVAEQLEGGVPDVPASVTVTASVTVDETGLAAASDVGQQIGAKATDGAAEAITAGAEKVRSAAASLADAVRSVGGNLSLAGYKIGGYFGDGVVDGMDSKADDVFRAGAALGNQATAGFNSTAKIASPSKVAIWQGNMIGQGVVDGMEDMYAAVRNASSGLASVATLASMPGMQLNYSPPPKAAYAGAGGTGGGFSLNYDLLAGKIAAAAAQHPLSVQVGGKEIARATATHNREALHDLDKRYDNGYGG